jgi:hypothetical protein
MTSQRTFRTAIPGDHVWTARVECASGVVDDNVRFYAPPGQEHDALRLRAPGTRPLSLTDRGPARIERGRSR